MIVDVKIEGMTPMLQHRFGEQSEGDVSKDTRAVLVTRGTPRDEAEKAVYRAPDKTIYMPGTYLSRMIREAGANHKLRGTRKSAKFVVPASVFVLADTIPLLGHDDEPLSTFEVDSRPVTIPATKGRIMRHRPRFDRWRARFSLRIIETMLPPSFVQTLLTEGGERLGLGDYRPERGGPFGTFRVLEWREQEARDKAAE